MNTPTTLRGVPTYADFVSKVNSLYDLLEELHYVDEVLDNLDHIESMRELQAVGNLTLNVAHYTVHVGSTHPFTREVPQLIPKVLFAQKISAARANAAAWAGSARRATLQRIDPWAAAYGHYFKTAHDMIARSRDQLMFVADDFGKLEHSLGHWIGPAADDFDTNFYKPVDTIRNNQRYALEAMRSAIVFADGLSNLCKHSIMNALDAADKCVREQLEARSREDRGSQSAAFQIMSVVTGLASAATFPIAPVSAGFGASSAVFGYAASAMEGRDSEQQTIKAKTADQVDHQLHQAIQLTNTNAGRIYAELEAKLQTVRDNIQTFEQLGTWFTRAPRLVDGVSPGSFTHLSSGRS